jgi:hypothetical protein
MGNKGDAIVARQCRGGPCDFFLPCKHTSGFFALNIRIRRYGGRNVGYAAAAD